MPFFRWQDHAQDLVREVAISFAKGENMDCVFETKGGLIKGHKLILSAVSPYFKRLLRKYYRNEPILLEQVKYRDLRMVLDFVYSGKIDIPVSEVSSFIKTANLLQITPFQKLYCSSALGKPLFVENGGVIDDRIFKKGERNTPQSASNAEKNDPVGNESISHPSFETILLPSVEAVMAVRKRKRGGKIPKSVDHSEVSSAIENENILGNDCGPENGKNVLSEDNNNFVFPQNINVKDNTIFGSNTVTETLCEVDQRTEEKDNEKGESENCDFSSGIDRFTEKTVENRNTSLVIAASISRRNKCDDLTKRLNPDLPSDVVGNFGVDVSEKCLKSDLQDDSLVEQMEEDVDFKSVSSVSELCKEVSSESLDLTVNRKLKEVHGDVQIQEENSWSSEENSVMDEEDTCMEAEIGDNLNEDAMRDPLDPLVDNAHSDVSKPSDMLLGSQDAMTQEQRTREEEESYRCFLCVAVFSAKSDYEYHFNSHKKIHRCNICSSTFRFKSLLERHVQIHTKDKTLHSCDICKAAFYSNNDLKTHLRTHTGVKPYPCNLCDAGFNYKCVLKRHLRTHTGERPYSCNICQATFVESGTLKYHLRTHTGEKPYVCTICPAAFTKRDSLKTHLRIHSGEKPYSCSTCNINFTYKSTLRRHMRMHKE